MTCNHEPFIARAIESALMQVTSFPVEILISEDDSTDNTRGIVRDYAERYPDRIRLLLSKKNLRSNEVVRRGLQAARGRYIALLDGDDFWTSPHKLQKQVDFLLQHPECSMCFHNAVVVDHEDREHSGLWTPPHQKEMSDLADIWRGNFIATCSAMLRADYVRDVSEWYNPFFPITDWPLYIVSAERGPIGYLSEVMGAYRLHQGSMYSSLPNAKKLESVATFYKRMNAALDFRHDRTARAGAGQFFFDWTEEYCRQGNLQLAGYALKLCRESGGVGISVAHRRYVRALGKLLAQKIQKLFAAS